MARKLVPGSECFKASDFKVSGWCGNRPKCVAVARNKKAVGVKDTKTGQVLMFSPGEWEAFIKGVKGGEFDV